MKESYWWDTDLDMEAKAISSTGQQEAEEGVINMSYLTGTHNDEEKLNCRAERSAAT